MTLLLDTHTLLWFLTNDSSLSARARGAIEDSANVTHVSAASLWEVAIKSGLGKLKLPAPYADIFPPPASNEWLWAASHHPRALCRAVDAAVQSP